jgi:hypothetical protein
MPTDCLQQDLRFLFGKPRKVVSKPAWNTHAAKEEVLH